MDDNDDKADLELVPLEEVRKIAEVLRGSGEVFEVLAKWLETHGIKEVQCRGFKTARRGIGYVGNFVASLLSGYHTARMSSPLPEAPPEVIAKSYSTREAARSIKNRASKTAAAALRIAEAEAKKRPKTGSKDGSEKS